MENYHGQHGWKEFNRNRKDILDEIDKVLEQTSNRPLQVAHGIAVEAKIRNWLSEFLPKKYGVTSGYIIPNLYDGNLTLYHYDIIIYNQFEAPILWTEGNFDQSEQGKSRAIPAKYVVCVYEVKSRLTKDNVISGLAKLREISIYNNQLNPLYTCGIIFIDLKEKDNNNKSVIKELLNGDDIPGFSGGMVLRYELDNSCIGIISVHNKSIANVNKKEHSIPIAKAIDDLDIFLLEDNNILCQGDGVGLKIVKTGYSDISVSKLYNVRYSNEINTLQIMWSRSNFSVFCINLLSTLEGLSYNDKDRPSFGQVFDTVNFKPSQLQNEVFISNQPFLDIYLDKIDEVKEQIKTNINSSEFSIIFNIRIENNGDLDAIITTDGFESTIVLPVRNKAEFTQTHDFKCNKDDFDFKKAIKLESIKIPIRIVYKENNSFTNYIYHEKTIVISENNVELL